MLQAMAKGGVNRGVLLEELVIADTARLSQHNEAAKALMRAARNLTHRGLGPAEVRDDHQQYVAITRFPPFPDGVVIGLYACQFEFGVTLDEARAERGVIAKQHF